MSKRSRITKRDKRFLIIPFQYIYANGVFRYKNQWWTKQFKCDALGIWGGLAVSTQNKFECRIPIASLVAAPIDSVDSTSYHKRVSDFYAE